MMETWEWNGVTWTRRFVGGPSPRVFYALAYDAGRARTVLFGGNSGSGATTTRFGDTWEWDGAAWMLVSSTGPSPRSGSAIVFDGQRVVLFGGTTAVGMQTDAWGWNGAAWTQLATTGFPGGPVAYDSIRGRAVVFHGTTGAPTTWEWDGVVWTQHSTTGPNQRLDVGLTFDSTRGKVVLFGGDLAGNLESGTFNDTWEWDGAAWTQRGPSGPLRRSNHALAYDSAAQATIMFGGFGVVPGQPLGDTWKWDGADWTQFQVPGPSPRFDHAMAYDQARNRIILVGGRSSSSSTANRLGDTWEWDGAAWSQRATAGPTSRFAHAMVYEPDRHRVLLGKRQQQRHHWAIRGSGTAPRGRSSK